MLSSTSGTEGGMRKKGCLPHAYDAEVRAKIGRYAATANGNKAADTKFSRELGSDVPESSVRNMKKTNFIVNY